jgi:hypothetical protein
VEIWGVALREAATLTIRWWEAAGWC